jgi:hypothetical protein
VTTGSLRIIYGVVAHGHMDRQGWAVGESVSSRTGERVIYEAFGTFEN